MVTFDETALAPDVVWVGSLPGLMCRGAETVRARLAQIRANGRSFSPEVLAEREDALLIDPHVDPPAELNPQLHQIAVLSDGLVCELRDYPDRASAVAAFEAMQ